MGKEKEINRIQLDLPVDVLKALQELAEKDKRTRKNYMEKLLTDHVEAHQKVKKA